MQIATPPNTTPPQQPPHSNSTRAHTHLITCIAVAFSCNVKACRTSSQLRFRLESQQSCYLCFNLPTSPGTKQSTLSTIPSLSHHSNATAFHRFARLDFSPAHPPFYDTINSCIQLLCRVQQAKIEEHTSELQSPA